MKKKWWIAGLAALVVLYAWALLDDTLVQVRHTTTRAYVESESSDSKKGGTRREWLRFKECVANGDTAQTCAQLVE